ncbi:50S ribosomal protein L11 methyltransferase [Peribacillus sp. NPDC094092]|uniref:50S ribosomal protein L11 methyltransferase n=1 Tax=Peribacillus sp. NPDC094092 TaxID=3390611 RepID=UPI003D0208D1
MLTDNDVIKDFFGNDLSVRYGPFAGMKYINKSLGSQLLPKILGSYEEPIQHWISEAITKNYSKLIDIGCAEGFYAVGVAYRMADIEIHAFDIDEMARNACYELAIRNKVVNRIKLKGECTHEELDNIVDKNTLIICDVEGAEKNLLSLKKSASLIKSDLIIETHDFIEAGITDSLINEFYNTHRIEMIVDYPRSTKKYPILNNYHYPHKVLDELRPSGMRWLRLTSLSNANPLI